MDEGLLAISIQIQTNPFSILHYPLVLSHQTLNMKGTVKAFLLHQTHQAQQDYVLHKVHQAQQAYLLNSRPISSNKTIKLSRFQKFQTFSEIPQRELP